REPEDAQQHAAASHDVEPHESISMRACVETLADAHRTRGLPRRTGATYEQIRRVTAGAQHLQTVIVARGEHERHRFAKCTLDRIAHPAIRARHDVLRQPGKAPKRSRCATVAA